MGRTLCACSLFVSVGLIAFAQTPPPAGGQTAPAPAAPAPGGQPAGGVTGTPAQDTARGATVLAEARKALGGDERLKAVQRIEVKGKSARAASPQFNIEGDFEIQVELPDKFRRKESLSMGNNPGGIEVLQLLNGKTASQTAEMQQAGGAIGGFDGGGDGGGGRGGRGGRGGMPNLAGIFGADGAGGEEATRQAIASEMSRLLMSMLLTSTEPVAWVGVAESPEGKADVLEFKTPDGTATRLMIDSKTRMPLMMQWTGTPTGLGAIAGRGNRGNQGGGNQGRGGRGGAPAGGPAPLQTYFSDYKTVNNIRLPHLIQSGANGETTEELVIKSYRINPSFRAETFQK